jgi:hypothetical protein
MTVKTYFKKFQGGVSMSNKGIRKFAKEKGVFLWEIARALGISEPTMTRRLRSELSEKEQTEMKSIIEKLSENKKTA